MKQAASLLESRISIDWIPLLLEATWQVIYSVLGSFKTTSAGEIKHRNYSSDSGEYSIILDVTWSLTTKCKMTSNDENKL
jgi:hypothetical protein